MDCRFAPVLFILINYFITFKSEYIDSIEKFIPVFRRVKFFIFIGKYYNTGNPLVMSVQQTIKVMQSRILCKQMVYKVTLRSHINKAVECHTFTKFIYRFAQL